MIVINPPARPPWGWVRLARVRGRRQVRGRESVASLLACAEERNAAGNGNSCEEAGRRRRNTGLPRANAAFPVGMGCAAGVPGVTLRQELGGGGEEREVHLSWPAHPK